jgi:hypothetical protein
MCFILSQISLCCIAAWVGCAACWFRVAMKEAGGPGRDLN